jgi:large subunit ribosomal protein L19
VSRNNLIIEEIEKDYTKESLAPVRVGDTVRVHTRIIEGQKERVQVFAGTVIAIKGKGLSKTFTVYRNAYGCSMERVFLFHSPRVAKIEIVRSGKVRRAKLYYLKGATGKAAKVEALIKKKKKVVAADVAVKPEVKE